MHIEALRPDGLNHSMKIEALAICLIGLVHGRVWGADPQTAGGTNLCPIKLVFPAPSFHSGPRRVESDPHTELFPEWPRPPFLAPVGTTNLALGKRVTTSDTNVSTAAVALITDGYKEEEEARMVALHSGKQWVQIDLGEPSSIYAVLLWHREYRDRVSYCVAVQTAEDSNFTEGVHTLFNNDYANLLGLGAGADKLYYETYSGKLVDGKGVKARYVRCYSRGNSDDRLNWYREVEVGGLPAK